MEERKIIQSGPGSYVVTLPIQWVRKNKFTKGSIVYVTEDTTNRVLVYPKFIEISKEQREIVIDASNFSDDELYNNIISSYLTNSKKILIKSLKEEFYLKVKMLISILPGLNVVEQSRNLLVIEDVLDVGSVNVKQTIQRIDMMVRDMITSIISEEKGSIIDMDHNVFGQSLFVKRILKYSLRDPAVMNAIGLNAEEIVDYILLVDQLENISNKIRNISQENLSQKQYKEYLKIFKILKEQYLNAINSFYTLDKNLATKVFQTKSVIYNIIKSIKNYSYKINTECILFDKSCRIVGRITFDKWKEFF